MSERRPRRGGFGRGITHRKSERFSVGSMKKLMGYMENTESACF